MPRRSRSQIIGSIPSNRLYSDSIKKFFAAEKDAVEKSGDEPVPSNNWVDVDIGVMMILNDYIKHMQIDQQFSENLMWNARLMKTDVQSDFALSWIGRSWGIGDGGYHGGISLVLMENGLNSIGLMSRNHGYLTKNNNVGSWNTGSIVSESTAWEKCILMRSQLGFEEQEIVTEKNKYLPFSLLMQFVSILSFADGFTRGRFMQYMETEQNDSLIGLLYEAALLHRKELCDALEELDPGVLRVCYPAALVNRDNVGSADNYLLTLTGGKEKKRASHPASRYDVSIDLTCVNDPTLIFDRHYDTYDVVFSLPTKIVVHTDYYDAFFDVRDANGNVNLETFQGLVMKNRLGLITEKRRVVMEESLRGVQEFIENYVNFVLNHSQVDNWPSLARSGKLSSILKRIGDIVEEAWRTEILLMRS